MKRKSDNDEIKYMVVETTVGDETYVDFMPELWLIPPTNECVVKERDYVRFYFPRRLAGQTKDKYMKFIKQAKFISMKPEDDGKWDINDGRVLKLETLEEAINSQKLYSDYFSTTEAEIAADPAPAPKKNVRKKKKTLQKTNDKSDTDDENRDVSTIPNYNIRYATETQDMFILDQGNNIPPINCNDDLLNESLCDVENGSSTQQQIQSNNMMNLEGILNETSELIMTIQVPVNHACNESTDGSFDSERQMEMTTIEKNDQQNDNLQGNWCKGHQKVLNKIDYFQKKTSKDIDNLRQEIRANHKQILELLNSRQRSEEDSQSEQTEDIQDDSEELNMDEIDEFNEKESEILVDLNMTLKNDPKFVNYLLSHLKKIKGDDEIKTTRKILKKLFDFRCLKDFTWQGTTNKQGTVKMKSFEKLNLVVELITKSLKVSHPNCDERSVVMKVVQQRTKSAKEAYGKLLERNAEALTARVDAIDNNCSTNDKQQETVISTQNAVDTQDPVSSVSNIVQ